MDNGQRKGENEMSEWRGNCDKLRVLSRVGLGLQTRSILTNISFVARINLKEKTYKIGDLKSLTFKFLSLDFYHCSLLILDKKAFLLSQKPLNLRHILSFLSGSLYFVSGIISGVVVGNFWSVKETFLRWSAV